MRIIPRKSKHGDMIFIFEFESKENEFDPIIALLKYFAGEILLDESKQAYLRLISTLENRCDSRYANDNCEVSSMLFANEMAAFGLWFIIILMYAENTVRSKHELDDFVDSITPVNNHADEDSVLVEE